MTLIKSRILLATAASASVLMLGACNSNNSANSPSTPSTTPSAAATPVTKSAAAVTVNGRPADQAFFIAEPVG